MSLLNDTSSVAISWTVIISEAVSEDSCGIASKPFDL